MMSSIAMMSISVLVATARKSPGSSNPKGANSDTGSFAMASDAIVPTIERFDPALDMIIPSREALENVATGFTWTEGPLWIQSGYLIFADIPSNSIRKWTPGAGVSIFMQPSGYKGLLHTAVLNLARTG
jgi:gluconolactonase